MDGWMDNIETFFLKIEMYELVDEILNVDAGSFGKEVDAVSGGTVALCNVCVGWTAKQLKTKRDIENTNNEVSVALV